MKKLLSRITAATLAAGMLVTEASASLVVPESTDPGTIAGSGMWLVQLYNEGDPDGDKPATDYGIDYSAVAGARFTIELDLDNPDLEENAFSLFEGNIGGGIVLSCCGGDIIQYEDDGETVTEIYSTYNWPSHNWWGIEFVNAEGETVDTNPNTMDDDLTNDNELSTVKTGDYTYTITADFVNPLSCETDEWEINEIAVMQLAFQEWGNDTIPVEITCCEILDADGEVLVWFDGQGNPSLENIAENTDTPSTGGDDADDTREVIELNGTTTTTTNEDGSTEGTMYQVQTTAAGGTVELQPTDTIYVTVAPTDDTIDTSEWVIALTGFTSEWGGWNGVTADSGESEFSATVQEIMDSIDVTDISDFGGFLLQVWNTDADVEIDWTITITPENSASGDSSDEYEVKYSAEGTSTSTLTEDDTIDATLLQVEGTNVGGSIEFQPDDVIKSVVAPVDSTVDTSEWSVAYNCFTSEWGGWRFVNTESGTLELEATVQDLMDALEITDISEFGGFLFQVWNTDADIEIEWSISILSKSSDDNNDEDSTPDLVLDLVEVSDGNRGSDLDLGGVAPFVSNDSEFIRMEIYNPQVNDDSAMLVDPEEFTGMTTITVYFSASNVTEEFTAEINFTDEEQKYTYFGEETEGITSYPVTVTEDGSYSVSIETDEPMNALAYLGVQTDIPYNENGETDNPDVPSDSEEYNAYLVVQTGAFSFRNKWNDETYGKDTEYFNSMTVWGDAEAYPEYSEYYDSDLEGYVIPVSFSDAKITGNGIYKVGLYDFDWALDGSTGFNVLSVSTDIPYDDSICFSDINVYVDGEKDSEFTGMIDSTDDYATLLLVNTWEPSIGDYTGTYPTESLEIEFTINGMSDSGAVAPDEPEPEPVPEHDGWIKFYMQNRGGDWAWLENDEYTIAFDEVGTYELSWADIQSIITNESGESLLYAPAEEWETYPSFGVEIGSTRITEVGQKGKVNARIEDITITLTDGTVFEIPARIIEQNLLGAEEDWGIVGYNACIDLKETIMATLEIEDYEYFDLIKAADSVSATVIVNEFVPLSEDDADADEDSSDNFYTADTVEITDIKVADNEVTFSWTESANAESYNIYLVDGDTRTFVAETTELTYTYVGEYCTEYTFAVCGCAGEREGSFAKFTVSTSHEYEEEYTTDREPTCSEAGAMSIHCKHCDARTNITEIETIDHDYSSVVVAPTYEREGYTLHMCAYCGDSYKTDATEMLALPAMTGVAVASRDAGSITFTWDEYLGLDVDGTMLGYVIEEMVDGEVRAGEDIDDITITQWKYTGLRSSTEYTIQIRAYGVDSAGKPIYTKGVILENVATLPASMTGFAVTGRGSDNLTLSWNKNATADGYVVQIQENNSWKNIAVIKSADTTSHVVTGLEPNSFYRFRMVAYKSYGTSKLYSKYTGAIPGYTAPAMVTGLTISASTDTTMTVTWDENAYADGFILDIYKDGKWQQAADVTSAETSVVIEGLTASTLYKFRIKSYASNGSLLINSTYSASVSGTTKPAAMSDVKVSASTSTSLTVSWNKNASATGYILQMYTDGVWKNIVNIKDINTTSYVISGLSASTSYKVRMVAYNNSTGSTLYGKYTGAITGTTSPAAVTNLRMTNRGTDFISVAWDKNANATGYMVYIYDGTSWKLVKTLTSASSVSHKITGLESGKTYKVNVKAYKTSGTQKLIADASMITTTTL